MKETANIYDKYSTKPIAGFKSGTGISLNQVNLKLNQRKRSQLINYPVVQYGLPSYKKDQSFSLLLGSLKQDLSYKGNKPLRSLAISTRNSPEYLRSLSVQPNTTKCYNKLMHIIKGDKQGSKQSDSEDSLVDRNEQLHQQIQVKMKKVKDMADAERKELIARERRLLIQNNQHIEFSEESVKNSHVSSRRFKIVDSLVLPDVPKTNTHKNQQEIKIYEEIQAKERYNRQRNKKKTQIELRRDQEFQSQKKLEATKKQRSQIEKHGAFIQQIIDQGIQEQGQVKEQTESREEDEAIKNVGVLGKYISKCLNNDNVEDDSIQFDMQTPAEEPSERKNNSVLSLKKNSSRAPSKFTFSKKRSIELSKRRSNEHTNSKGGRNSNFILMQEYSSDVHRGEEEIYEEDYFAQPNLIDKLHDTNENFNKNRMKFRLKINEKESSEQKDGTFDTRSSFAKKFPDFVTGLTPNLPPESSLETQEKEKYYKRGKIFKKQDFKEVASRQQNFKELMMLNTQSDELYSKSFLYNEKDGQPSETDSSFPYLREGQGMNYKLYQEFVQKEKKIKKKLEEDRQRKKVMREAQERASRSASIVGEESPTIEDEKSLQLSIDVLEIVEDHQPKNNKQQILMEKFLEYLKQENFQKNIEQVQDKLEKNVLKQGFENYEQIKDPQIKQFAKDIQQKRQFFNLCKNISNPKNFELYINDPSVIFMKKCYEQNIPIMSLLQKINDKNLNLVEYKLNDEICKALGEACKYFPDQINSVMLDTNGLRDKGMAALLTGLSNLTHLRRFVCKNNEFSYNSYCILKNILERELPNQLDELRLNGCRLGKNLCIELFQYLTENCMLRKLGIVKAFLPNESVDSLILLINNNQFLIDLDISWNELGQAKMQDIAVNLAQNRQLQIVNLSMNSFTRDQSIDQGKEKQMSLEEKDLIQNICKFIKYNARLIHFNISYTNLTKLMLYEIGPALRRSKSMQSLHLSGNPGIDDEIKQYLHERAHCMPFLKEFNLIQSIRKDIEKYGKHKLLEEAIKIKQIQKDKFIADDAVITNNDWNKLSFDRILGHKQDIPGSGQWRQIVDQNQKCWICNRNVYSVVIWSKKFGWESQGQVDQMIEELIIQKIEERQTQMKFLYESGEYENRDHILNYNTELGESGSSPNAPVLFGSFTNWNPVQMIPIEDFCEMIDQDKPNFVQLLKQLKNKVRKQVLREEEMNESEKEYLERLKLSIKKTYRYRWKYIMKVNLRFKRANLVNYETHQEEGAKPITEFSETKSDHTQSDFTLNNESEDQQQIEQSIIKTNSTKKRKEEEERIYVYPCFMKPGKHMYVVRVDDQQTQQLIKLTDNSQTSSLRTENLMSEYFAHNVVAPYRSEDIPVFVKPSKFTRKQRVFNKANSVFKDWKEDTPARLDQSAQHDFEFWKLNKFVKQIDEQQECEKIIKDNIEVLKTLQIYYSSRSNFPYTNDFEYRNFVQQFGINKYSDGKQILQGDIDNSFKSAVSNMTQVEGTQQHFLLRLQFLELIVRLGEAKYKKSGMASTYPEALQMIMQNDILPNVTEIIEEWEGFRLKKLWTIEVNDLFKANLTNIQKLMRHYYQPRQQYVSQQDVFQMFCTDTDLLLEKDASYLFGMSKMPNPLETKNIKAYKSIANVTELLEMIARVGDFKFKNLQSMSTGIGDLHQSLNDNSQMELTDKIIYVLNKILPIINAKTIIPKKGDDIDESESDEDY